MSRHRTTVVAASGAAVLALAAAAPAAADNHEATVTIVHGVALDAAATVDVWAVPAGATSAEGPLLDDFDYTDIERATVPPGTYDLYVTAPDAEDFSSPVISATGVEVAAGAATVVAAQPPEGDPELTVFADDLSSVAEGKANLFVRHTAAAPPVDVIANDSVTLAEGLAYSEEAAATGLDAGTYSVTVQAGGEAVPGLSVDGVELEGGMSYFAYAVGNGDAGYQLLLDARDVGTGGEMPTEVPAGQDGGSSVPLPGLLLVLAGGALAAAAAGRMVLARGRS